MGKMAGRPMVQDLVKAAMVDASARVRITEEARLQSEKTAEEKCSKCHKEMHKGACMGKEASAAVDDHAVKLAGALDFIVSEMAKEAEGGVGNPEGVSHATASTPLPDHKGQGIHITPMHPAMQKGLKTEQGETQMANTLDHAPGGSGKMVENNSGKTASIADLVRAKLAAKDAEEKETEGLKEVEKGLAKTEKAHESEPENKDKKASSLADYMSQIVAEKVAEDAINPAHISAGKNDTALDTSAAGEGGGAPVGGAPQGPTSLVGSTESAINYTRGDAYAGRKTESKKYWEEPMQSAAHDTTLRVAFENTGKAGPKLASAPVPAISVKTAAARLLLSKIAEGAANNGSGQ